VNGTHAFINATDDGTKTMHWLYNGLSNDTIGNNYALVFDATFL